MELIKATSKAYSYTIKKVDRRTPTTNASYEKWFTFLEKHTTIEFKCRELDSKNVIHYHGIFHCPKRFYVKRLSRKGYHIQIEELYSKKVWVKYIQKDQLPRDRFPRSPKFNIPKYRLFKIN